MGFIGELLGGGQDAPKAPEIRPVEAAAPQPDLSLLARIREQQQRLRASRATLVIDPSTSTPNESGSTGLSLPKL